MSALWDFATNPVTLWFAVGLLVVGAVVYYTNWADPDSGGPGFIFIPAFGVPLWPLLLLIIAGIKLHEAGERRRERIKELRRTRECEDREAERLLRSEGINI